jgi:hypothetical protein
MATTARRWTIAVTTWVALLAIGAIAAFVIGDRLRTRVDPAGPLAFAARLGFDPDLLVTWTARVLLVLALAWLLIGMVAARTRLVRRPGAASARASWLASSRPWRARESTLGMLPLDRWLMIVVPAGLLVATWSLQTSFSGWPYVAAVLGAWLVFAVVARLALGRRSPWPVIAVVGGVVVLRSILVLGILSFTGPGGWATFWAEPVGRAIYITLATALLLWAFVAAAWALTVQRAASRARRQG